MTSPAAPSTTQLLFARAVIFTFDLWPALRLAISEQWGGIESKSKADFLISYLCDQYSEEGPLNSTMTTAARSNATSSSVQTIVAPSTPDVDDLAEILEGYFADEFESRLEDNSADWVAARLVQLHKVIYTVFPPTQESLTAANQEIDKLEQAAVALRGKKVTAQMTEASDESVSGSDDEGGNSDGEVEMDVDDTPPVQSTKPEPIVDEDGFTTVVKAKRR